MCVCVCVVLGTRRSACAQTFQWERCLDEAGLRCVCRWARVCIWMNHTLDLWSNVSLVFSSIADTHTHTLDASKSPKCSACVCWDVSQWENTHWQPAAHILLPAGGCDHLQPAHCPLTPGEVSSIFQRFETQPSLVCGPLCRNSIQSRSSLHSGHPVIAANWRQQWSFFSSSSYKLPLCIPKGVFIFLEATLLCCFLSAALQDFLSFFFFFLLPKLLSKELQDASDIQVMESLICVLFSRS